MPSGNSGQPAAGANPSPQDSKKKLTVVIAAVVAVVLIVVATVAFNLHRSSKPTSNGGNPKITSQPKKSSNSDDMKTYGLSQLLKRGQSIWFVSDKEPTKTTAPYVLVFDKGKVTRYGTAYGKYRAFNYSDLKGVKSGQLLQKIRQWDRKNFESTIKMYSDQLQKRLDRLQQHVQSNSPYCTATTDDTQSAGSTSKADPGCKREMADVKASMANLKTFKYRAPEPGAYKLSIETDDTGNVTKLEHVQFSGGNLRIEDVTPSEGVKPNPDIDSYGSYTEQALEDVPGGSKVSKEPVDTYSLKWGEGKYGENLTGMARPYQVYDKTYDGLCYVDPDNHLTETFMLQMAPDGKSLPTRVMLDQPGAKGVKIVS